MNAPIRESNDQVTDATVLGCGAMGSGIAKTLADRQFTVTVWNRTGSKADAVAGARISVADTPQEAIAASPVTFVCVMGADVSRELLESASDVLAGTLFVMVPYLTSEGSRELDAYLRSQGGRHLDASYVSYPSNLGTEIALMYYSGDREAFESARPLFEALGEYEYVGETPGRAYQAEIPLLLAYLPMAVSLLQAVELCGRHDLSVEQWMETVSRMYPLWIDDLLETIEADVDPTDPANIDAPVSSWRDGAEDYATFLREAGLDPGMYDALVRMFRAGEAAGRGDHDWTAIGDVVADPPEG